MTGPVPATKSLVLLVADDDEDDWEFIGNALGEVGSNRVTFVRDGQELLDYLRREGVHTGRADRDRPDLVILDLKMPKMGGAEALSEIRSDPTLMRLPVVVLTTSMSEHVLNDTYERGANSVISKPSSYIGLVEVLRTVRAYWANAVSLPTSAPNLRALHDLGEPSPRAYPVEPQPAQPGYWRRRRSQS